MCFSCRFSLFLRHIQRFVSWKSHVLSLILSKVKKKNYTNFAVVRQLKIDVAYPYINMQNIHATFYFPCSWREKTILSNDVSGNILNRINSLSSFFIYQQKYDTITQQKYFFCYIKIFVARVFQIVIKCSSRFYVVLQSPVKQERRETAEQSERVSAKGSSKHFPQLSPSDNKCGTRKIKISHTQKIRPCHDKFFVSSKNYKTWYFISMESTTTQH